MNTVHSLRNCISECLGIPPRSAGTDFLPWEVPLFQFANLWRRDCQCFRQTVHLNERTWGTCTLAAWPSGLTTSRSAQSWRAACVCTLSTPCTIDGLSPSMSSSLFDNLHMFCWNNWKDGCIYWAMASCSSAELLRQNCTIAIHPLFHINMFTTKFWPITKLLTCTPEEKKSSVHY